MALTIESPNFTQDQGDSVFYEEDWQLLIETHIPFLKKQNDTTVISVDPFYAYLYEGDLQSFLQQLSPAIPPQYAFIVMRMNDMRSPLEFGPRFTSLLIPSSQRIEALRNIYQTETKKIN